MSNYLNALLCFFLVILFSENLIADDTYVSFSIDGSAMTSQVGDIYETPLNYISKHGALGAYELRLTYDSSRIKIQHITIPPESVFAGNTSFNPETFDTGETIITAFQTSSDAETHDPTPLAIIRWQVISDVVERDAIILYPVTVLDTNWAPLTVGHSSVSLNGQYVPALNNAIPKSFTIKQCTVSASKNRTPAKDSIAFVCTSFDLESVDFGNSNLVYIEIVNNDPESNMIYDTLFNVNEGFYKNDVFTYKNEEKGVHGFRANIKKNELKLNLQNIDLSGLQEIFTITITIGENTLVGLSSPDIVNKAKPVPIPLYFDNTDMIRVKKHKLLLNANEENADSLLIRGDISFQNRNMDYTGQPVIIHWGDSQIVLPSDKIVQVKEKMIFLYKRSQQEDISIAMMNINMINGTFTIKINNANIGVQESPVEFGLSIGNFNEGDIVQLKE